jgi:hypothetical protein
MIVAGLPATSAALLLPRLEAKAAKTKLSADNTFSGPVFGLAL